jgi:SAM-dependent methyltransferase
MYDDLITDPVEPWVAAVVGVESSSRAVGSILDAGCGTGRYAAALIAVGYEVDLVDASPDLLHVAAQRCPTARLRQADICGLPPTESYALVMCRGVLNDLVGDDERFHALQSLAGQLKPGGTLLLDVRERESARRRAGGEPLRRIVLLPENRTLTYTSATSWSNGLLLASERHEERGTNGSLIRCDTFEFTMRPWTETELTEGLASVGLGDVTIRSGVGRAKPDRRFVTAQRAIQ